MERGDTPVKPATGMPRWLVYALAGKLVLVMAITGGIVWWVHR